MKKQIRVICILLILSALSSSRSFAANIYDKTSQSLQKEKINLILKGTSTKEILSIDISPDKSKILAASADDTLKIWDLSQKELIKTFNLPNLVQANFTKQAIVALTQNKLAIYDQSDFKKITDVENTDMTFFTLSKDFSLLCLIVDNKRKAILINLETGNIKSKLEKYYIKSALFSPDNKYLAVSANRKTYIYTVDSATLIVELPQVPYETKYMKFTDNDNVLIASSNYSGSAIYVYNFKTSQLVYKSKDFGSYGIEAAAYSGIKNKIFFFTKDSLNLYNIQEDKIEKMFDTPRSKTYDLTTQIKAADDLSIMLCGYKYGDIKAYDTAPFFKDIIKPQQIMQNTADTSKTDIKDQEKTKKPLKFKLKENFNPADQNSSQPEKTQEKPKKHVNKAPQLEIYASKTSGFIPLKTDIRLIASDEDGKISSYYINIAGREYTDKGYPKKTFSHTFTKPGKYNIFAAVKDNEGKMTTKQIVIETREETFLDYKKQMGVK